MFVVAWRIGGPALNLRVHSSYPQRGPKVPRERRDDNCAGSIPVPDGTAACRRPYSRRPTVQGISVICVCYKGDCNDGRTRLSSAIEPWSRTRHEPTWPRSSVARTSSRRWRLGTRRWRGRASDLLARANRRSQPPRMPEPAPPHSQGTSLGRGADRVPCGQSRVVSRSPGL
jgi:hypothetical protein